ncbi:MAG TPA: sodium:proton antiporter NhaD [Chloroflexota bacterium]|nr:sodium:proton antiporter NhaD [Chloroflexota bacterium]
MDFTAHWAGLAALAVFVVAYAAVMAEEQLQLRKSQPALVAAGVIWLLTGVAYAQAGESEALAEAARHNLLEFAELFLFLLVAMTYVNTMGERGVFSALRSWLVGQGFSLRTLFWITGGLAFLISPVADNLTTALLLGTVAVAVGQGHPRFVGLACINVVVAANAGGAFSPFGDITTLMVWQEGIISFFGFFALVAPALINWLLPAAIMSLAVEHGQPEALEELPVLEPGAWSVVVLFLGTIALTVALQHFLHLPPALGMMAGLGGLKLYSYVLNHFVRRRAGGDVAVINELDDVFAQPHLEETLDGEADGVSDPAPGAQHLAPAAEPGTAGGVPAGQRTAKPLDIFARLEQVEWDTLMFFYGVILAVGGLGALGYLAAASRIFYGGLGATTANLLIGLLSAVIDNVPVMFAVLTMRPEMSTGQWLLVTLTAGVGGSLLSIGSAAGVALMGQARGSYTFLTHLKWSWAVALGYAASVAVHFLVNRHLF